MFLKYCCKITKKQLVDSETCVSKKKYIGVTNCQMAVILFVINMIESITNKRK